MSLGEGFHCKYSLIERSGEDSLHLGVLVHCFALTVLGLLTPDRSWLFYRFTAMCIDDCTTVRVLHGRKVKIGGEGRGRRREVAYEKLWWSLACVLACAIAVHSFTHAHVQLMLVSVLINIALFFVWSVGIITPFLPPA